MDRPPILPLSIEWFKPEDIAEAVGMSVRTVYDRYDDLVGRGQMTRHKRALWTRTEAQKLADFIAASSRKAVPKK